MTKERSANDHKFSSAILFRKKFVQDGLPVSNKLNVR